MEQCRELPRSKIRPKPQSVWAVWAVKDGVGCVGCVACVARFRRFSIVVTRNSVSPFPPPPFLWVIIPNFDTSFSISLSQHSIFDRCFHSPLLHPAKHFSLRSPCTDSRSARQRPHGQTGWAAWTMGWSSQRVTELRCWTCLSADTKSCIACVLGFLRTRRSPCRTRCRLLPRTR
jgi:hypothetical protein